MTTTRLDAPPVGIAPGAAAGLSFPGAAPSIRHPRHPFLRLGAIAVSLLVLAPILALVLLALDGANEDLPHLLRNVIPGAAFTTFALMAMVAVLTAATGIGTAWLVAAYDFPLRRLLAWALVLPLAVPGYLAAYAFVEFFQYAGPVQGLVRAAFGFRTIRDYWFPEIRSTPGAALVLGSVLYPYVYLAARVVFLMQGRAIADAARTLGARPGAVFRRVLLPVARPAVVAGVALALMETLNDIGASEYLGVRTLTFSVYSTWLNQGSLQGAAQIALAMLLVVLGLLWAEGQARRAQRFHGARATQMKVHAPRTRLPGLRGLAALGLGLLPVLLGFGIPLGVFGQFAWRRLDGAWTPQLADALASTVLTAGLTALTTGALALFLLDAVRLCRARRVAFAVRLASIGYALPGGILGLGLLFALATLDRVLGAAAHALFHASTGLLVSGTAAAVVIACTIRFLALAEGTLRTGLEKLPPHLDEAARTLDRTAGQSARQVLLPLLRPALLTALVLVFVDATKELSATILLRPFGFNTLATLAYENASRGLPQDGAWAALLIIATALVPVILLARALAEDRAA